MASNAGEIGAQCSIVQLPLPSRGNIPEGGRGLELGDLGDLEGRTLPDVFSKSLSQPSPSGSYPRRGSLVHRMYREHRTRHRVSPPPLTASTPTHHSLHEERDGLLPLPPLPPLLQSFGIYSVMEAAAFVRRPPTSAVLRRIYRLAREANWKSGKPLAWTRRLLLSYSASPVSACSPGGTRTRLAGICLLPLPMNARRNERPRECTCMCGVAMCTNPSTLQRLDPQPRPATSPIHSSLPRIGSIVASVYHAHPYLYRGPFKLHGGS